MARGPWQDLTAELGHLTLAWIRSRVYVASAADQPQEMSGCCRKAYRFLKAC